MCIKNFFKTAKLIVFAIVVSCSTEVCAQGYPPKIRIHFDQGQHQIKNHSETELLDSVVFALRQFKSRPITKATIDCCASPEGGYARNIQLANLRGESGRTYLVEQCALPDSIIKIISATVPWDEYLAVAKDQDVEYRGGRRHVVNNQSKLLPQFRYIDITLYNHPAGHIVAATYPLAYTFAECELSPVTRCKSLGQSYPLFALKTNLLFDLATLINIEVEVPIRKHCSIAGEFIFPWWTIDNQKADSRRNRVQLRNANLEGRYWWGDRENRPILTGWFSGVYAGGGIYDFEHNAKGYQGDFFIAAGLSGGYAHTINRSETLRLEYSLGIGYLSTDYQYYHAEFCHNSVWHAIEQRSGKYHWFGPTRAKVSLSWLINCNSKR